MRFKQGHWICIAMLFLLITSYSFGLKTKTSMKTKIRNNEHHISKLNDNKKVNIESAKEKESINQSVQPQLLDKNTKSDLLDWNNIKKVLVSHQVIILYWTCIIILTSLLLIMFKSLKVILYTNKYNEKDLFSARKLFKSKDGEASKSRTKFGAISNAAKEHQQELADTESCGFKHSWGTINVESESDQLTSNQRGSWSINSHIDGERVQGVQRRNHLERKTNDEPEILSCFSIDKSDDFAIMPRKYIKPNFEEKRDKRVEYYKEREKAIFGYDDKEEDFPNFKIKQRKPKKEDKGIKNFTVKYDFSDNESEQEGVFYEYFPKPKVQRKLILFNFYK